MNLVLTKIPRTSAHLWNIFNSLTPGKFEQKFKFVIFKWILMIDGWSISCEIALIWMLLDFTDDQSTLVKVMAWCRQATSHYLSQCWPRSLSPYGITRLQWVNWCFHYSLTVLSVISKLGNTYLYDVHFISIFNTLGPSDALWRQISGSTLAQVMACCLTSPSQYLNQYWLIISKV